MARPNKGDRFHISLKVPIDILAKLDTLAEKNRRDRSSEIIVAIEEHLEKEERRAQLLENTSSDGSEILELLKHNAELMEQIVKSQRKDE